MRSYYSHLETATNAGKASISKPVCRSSAIFPVMELPSISSRVLFMGYWMLKRHIHQIGSVITLRDLSGQLIYRTNQLIEEAKPFRIEVRELLNLSGYSPTEKFFGSLEVEFFSTVNLVFPFPAVSVNYYGPKFSSIVHTAQRVYNDFDDMRNNSQTSVPESGFNIYADDMQEPFIAIINGPEPVPECKVQLQFFNLNHELLTHELNLGKIEAYQTHFLYPSQLVNLKEFLKGSVGAAKVHFHVNWIFPRLLVGNINHSLPAISLTHSYYDCHNARSESDYWLTPKPEWHPASLMIPLCVSGDHFTNIYFYPIYSPSNIAIDLELYDATGQCLVVKTNFLKLESNEEFKQIDFKKIADELHLSLPHELAARIIARPIGESRIPARIKIGLDIGHLKQKIMPCNICTNLQPFNPPLETKPSTFRWAPLLTDQPNSSLWIMNSSPAVNYQRSAKVILTFFHEQDTSTLSREITIPPQGFVTIKPDEDEELRTFFDGKIGWCTAVSTNPYTTTYYFSDNASGVVGGDHGF